MRQGQETAQPDPIRDLLKEAGVNLGDLVITGWPHGVCLTGPWGSGPLSYNVGCQSPPWVNYLLKEAGPRGDLLMRAILAMISSGHGIETARYELEGQIAKLCSQWLYGAN
jgi:hypothetical protein